MRISCGADVHTCRDTLERDIRILGLQPIVTSQVVRAVYEGDDEHVVNCLIQLFSSQPDHDIYTDGLPKPEPQPPAEPELVPRGKKKKRRRYTY